MGPTPVQVLEALVSIQTVFHMILLCGTFQQVTVVSPALAPALASALEQFPAAFMKAKALRGGSKSNLV